jgi:DNA-binding NarL/FixJ family response regulator
MTTTLHDLIIVDDHEVFRFGLQTLVSRHRNLRWVGSATNGKEALELASRLRPQIAIMDMKMPVCDGLEATRQLAKYVPETKVLAFSVRPDPSSVVAALRAGAFGYVCKSSDHHVLFEAILVVAQGRRFIDPALADSVVTNFLNDHAGETDTLLSAREQQVLVRLAGGATSGDIAAELDLSPKTVDSYKTRACDKLGLKGRREIVRFAIMSGWLDDPSTNSPNRSLEFGDSRT